MKLKCLCALLSVCLLLCGAAMAGEPYPQTEDLLQLPLQIAPDLPAMTLDITRMGEKGVDGQTVYEYRFSLLNEDMTGGIPTFFMESEVPLDPEFLVTFADLNFDGYLDLDIAYAYYASNMAHRFYLWAPEEGAYDSAALTNLELSWYTLYPEQQIIYSYVHDSASTGDTALHRWQDGRLVKVRDMITRYTGDMMDYTVTMTDYTGDAPHVLLDETIPSDTYLEQFDAREATLWEGIE